MNQPSRYFALTLLLVWTAYIPPVQAQDSLLKEADAEELNRVIDSFRGEKAVLVNVWATWCGPCKEEFPYIVKLQRQYKDRLKVIFISTDFERAPAEKFLENHGVDWTTYLASNRGPAFIEGLSEEWSGAMPFTVIYNSRGEMVASWESSAEYEKFKTYTEKAIKSDKP